MNTYFLSLLDQSRKRGVGEEDETEKQVGRKSYWFTDENFVFETYNHPRKRTKLISSVHVEHVFSNIWKFRHILGYMEASFTIGSGYTKFKKENLQPELDKLLSLYKFPKMNLIVRWFLYLSY
jgi:hypothetical protein